MFADAVLSAILKCESLQGSKIMALPTTVDNVRFKVRLVLIHYLVCEKS